MEIMSRNEAYEKAMGIIAKGYPNNSDELEYLVLYLSNINGRGYDEVIEYLRSIGEPVIPYIKKYLQTSSEDELHSSLLFTIVRYWPKEWIEKIVNELNDLAWLGNWGVDIDAIEILIKNGFAKMGNPKFLIDSMIQGCDRKRKDLENLKRILDEIE